jgi:subtilisin family serine protease
MVTEAMTTGATTSSDRKASWSNYGSCVDWFAPGVSITSAWYSSRAGPGAIFCDRLAIGSLGETAGLEARPRPC